MYTSVCSQLSSMVNETQYFTLDSKQTLRNCAYTYRVPLIRLAASLALSVCRRPPKANWWHFLVINFATGEMENPIFVIYFGRVPAIWFFASGPCQIKSGRWHILYTITLIRCIRTSLESTRIHELIIIHSSLSLLRTYFLFVYIGLAIWKRALSSAPKINANKKEKKNSSVYTVNFTVSFISSQYLSDEWKKSSAKQTITNDLKKNF